MTLARVVATIVSTEKHVHYRGQKILVVQPVGPDGKPRGKSLVAVDGVQAGIGDLVLVVDEGGSARTVIGDESAVTIRTAVCGIVDRVDMEEGREKVSDRANTPNDAGTHRDNVRSVAIGSDHGAVTQKETLKTYLQTVGYRVVDVGCFGAEKVDYPDIAVAVCRKVVSGDCERGIVLDGAGIGSCMAANKIKGIRAAMCYDIRTVINSREHNNANVLSLGGPLHDAGQLCDMAKTWLETRFGGGRHMVRVNKIMAIERGSAGGGEE